MWISPLTLTGRAARLEPLHIRHAEGLLAAANDGGPELFRFTPQAPQEWSIDGFRAQIEKVNAISNIVAFAIVHQPSEAVIGRTTFMEIRPEHRTAEIGRTWIALSHQGTAVNPEIKLLMMTHAFERLEATRIQFTTSHENLHSQRAIAKLGAVREGVLRNHMILPDGRNRDTVMYSVIRDEWPPVKQGLQRRLGYEL